MGRPERGQSVLGQPERCPPVRSRPDRDQPEQGQPGRGLPSHCQPEEGQPVRGRPERGQPGRSSPTEYHEGANWKDADLTGADLIGAYGAYDVISIQVLEEQATFLEGATMPNGQKYEDCTRTGSRARAARRVGKQADLRNGISEALRPHPLHRRPFVQLKPHISRFSENSLYRKPMIG